MALRFTLFVFAIATLFSCQTIMHHYFGIKKPEIEKNDTVLRLIAKNKIANAHFIKKDKIHDAYVGTFPKVFVFDKGGHEVILPRCYEMLEDNLKRLLDTMPKRVSTEAIRDKFVQETIQTEGNSIHSIGQYDYEVFFYWSVWLGKFNIDKLRNAQKTINAINQTPNHKKIILIPINFDFIEESGWTKQSMDAELISVGESQKKAKNSTNPIQSLNVAKAQLLTVKKRTVLVVASQQSPTKVDRYYVLQGTATKELSIPKSILNESNDFVSIQAEPNFWVLTLSESDRYRNFLTDGANVKVLKGFGLAKYQEGGLDFDMFISELKSGKHDSKFN